MTFVKGLTSNNTSKKKLKFSSSEEKRQYLEYQKWKEKEASEAWQKFQALAHAYEIGKEDLYYPLNK